jgi:hypothetical protein
VRVASPRTLRHVDREINSLVLRSTDCSSELWAFAADRRSGTGGTPALSLGSNPKVPAA